ncbi:HAMP domain-containing histidine kinase [Chitinophaga sedimenti]|uniref:sensor histidine kinase n=1 Tax=Chitinophaga sedimenti TaxID=2033606 RepID=UPI002005194E|nr:HAMP domain-containing sensor histidine kinase [Chitinophaga sedimenti]MCK7554153.1 HAMP domain-containing histidine kinase [Chitinophaga sedimenti]
MYAIKVLPAWYQTTWFRIMAALVVSMLVFAFFWWRVHRELLKNMQLERRVIARTLELRANLQQLQRSEEQLRKQGHVQQRLLAAISHDIKTPLQFVLAALEKSAKRSAELKGEEREAVYDSLWRMSQLVNNMVDYMKAQLLPDAVPVVADIDMLLGEKAAFFRPLAAAKGVELINDIQFHEPVLISRQLLAVVLHNLLDNAVKYTRTGTIHLHMEELAGEMHVHVNDTGTGMPTPLVNWINNYGNAGYEAELEAFTHTGLGLLIVMELLQHIGGRIQVHRRPSGGTAIMIAIRVIRPGSYAALSSPAVL